MESSFINLLSFNGFNYGHCRVALCRASWDFGKQFNKSFINFFGDFFFKQKFINFLGPLEAHSTNSFQK